ncbi:hypothetical protein BHF71_05205 [Vulcanibacillus modesticaldus]|uniref:Septum formation initiator n=1 Tax=Vulcanibacillus modesticaldus TaxID=337097 RepID=A0A1D2YXC6_9BACI|nr:septum formation initiator family protein [Vulcanibacillus modesticaldus]OEG00303.1 hypothetical protein BHF71_05205 [Vulcanibacillus modesticaldus]
MQVKKHNLSKINNPSKKRIKGILLILAAFSLWAIFTVYHQWQDISEIKGKLVELKKEEQRVLTIKNDLEKKAQLLQNKDYIAELARKYYFLSKPGEIIIISLEE